MQEQIKVTWYSCFRFHT